MSRNRQRILLPLVKNHLALVFSSSSSRPAKIMALTSEICERYGDTANYRIRCFLCKEICHRKVNCPKNDWLDNQAGINVLSEDIVFEEGPSDGSDNELVQENY